MRLCCRASEDMGANSRIDSGPDRAVLEYAGGAQIGGRQEQFTDLTSLACTLSVALLSVWKAARGRRILLLGLLLSLRVK